MFGSKRMPPVDSPFAHGPDCPHQDLRPAWGFQIGPARWERTCCHTETVYVTNGELDPNSNTAEPSWRAHVHSPSCEAPDTEAVVKIARREGASGWISRCHSCMSEWVYYWDPDRVDRYGRPIRREANCLYRYELKRALVTAT